MKKLTFLLLLSLVFISCKKTPQDYQLIPKNEIPSWLQTRINQDEVTIKENPKYVLAWGAWVRYKWQNNYFFEYHNPLWQTTVAPVSETGDTLYFGATNMDYYNGKCCEQFVWRGPLYIEF